MLIFDSALENWAPYKERRHALALTIGGGRFAIAVVRRDDVPIVVAAHSLPYDGSALPIVSRIIPAASRYAVRSVWTTEATTIDLQHPALRLQRVETLQRPTGPKGPAVDGRTLTPAPHAVCPRIDEDDATLMSAVHIAAFVANQYPRPLTPQEARDRAESMARLRSAFW